MNGPCVPLGWARAEAAESGGAGAAGSPAGVCPHLTEAVCFVFWDTLQRSHPQKSTFDCLKPGDSGGACTRALQLGLKQQLWGLQAITYLLLVNHLVSNAENRRKQDSRKAPECRWTGSRSARWPSGAATPNLCQGSDSFSFSELEPG